MEELRLAGKLIGKTIGLEQENKNILLQLEYDNNECKVEDLEGEDRADCVSTIVSSLSFDYHGQIELFNKEEGHNSSFGWYFKLRDDGQDDLSLSP